MLWLHQPEPLPPNTHLLFPELANEESVPSDGKDPKGEKMMEELGRSKPGRPLQPDREEG